MPPDTAPPPTALQEPNLINVPPAPQTEPQLQPSLDSNPPASQQLPSAAPAFSNQPNPAPYTPPPSANQQPPSISSTITKLRKVLIILGFVFLVLLIAIAVWFLVLNKSQKQGAVTTQVPEVQINLPSTPPARTSGGFSELPATPSAPEATQPAQVAQ